MKNCVMVLLVGLLASPRVATAEDSYPDLAKRIPHLAQRLQSSRWEVRYCLLSELSGRDPESKRALEALARDRNEAVANQAVVRYVNNFLNVEKTLFKPALYVPRCFPLADLPAENPDRALVDYCLGRRKIEPARGPGRDDTQPILPVLDPAQLDNPRMHETLTIVGILGGPGDAEALYPFLLSPNSYVAIGAAKAVVRLGQAAKGLEALRRLTELDPSKELHCVTEASYVLREMNYPGLREIVRRVLNSIDGGKQIQPNWVSGFLLLAAEVEGESVWRAKEGVEPK